MISPFRDSGYGDFMNYSIRPARSRGRTKRGNLFMKGRTCFESSKIIVARVIKLQRSTISRRKKRKPSLDFKHQNENCDRLKKQGQLQHRLQLGMPPSCEARRIVDHVPILGKWSQKLNQVERLPRKEDRRGKKTMFFTLKSFFKIRYSFQT